MLEPLLTIDISPSLLCLIRGFSSCSKYLAWSPYSNLQSYIHSIQSLIQAVPLFITLSFILVTEFCFWSK